MGWDRGWPVHTSVETISEDTFSCSCWRKHRNTARGQARGARVLGSETAGMSWPPAASSIRSCEPPPCVSYLCRAVCGKEYSSLWRSFDRRQQKRWVSMTAV